MLNVPTIHELRKLGNKVRITHFRNVIVKDTIAYTDFVRVTKEDKKARKYSHIYSHGGETNIELTTPANQTFTSKAHCSDADPFNRRLGIRICLGRLQKQGVI